MVCKLDATNWIIQLKLIAGVITTAEPVSHLLYYKAQHTTLLFWICCWNKVYRDTQALSQIKIVQRTKFFSWQNAFTKLFAEWTIKVPVVSIRIRSTGHSSSDVEWTPTSSRGRREFEMKKSLRGWYVQSSLTPSHFTTMEKGQRLSL